jgi:hypothetical protein
MMSSKEACSKFLYFTPFISPTPRNLGYINYTRKHEIYVEITRNTEIIFENCARYLA